MFQLDRGSRFYNAEKIKLSNNTLCLHFNLRMSTPVLKINLMAGAGEGSYKLAQIEEYIQYRKIGDFEILLNPDNITYFTDRIDTYENQGWAVKRTNKRRKRFKQLVLSALFAFLGYIISVLGEDTNNGLVTFVGAMAVFLFIIIGVVRLVGFIINR